MAAAEAIGRFSSLRDLTLQPLFFLANAEEWGYAGSRRFARDISQGISCEAQVNGDDSPSGLPMCTAPIYPTTLFEAISASGISTVLAVDQIGRLYGGELFLHTLAEGGPVTEAILTASEGVEGVSVLEASHIRIPPTPMTSFINEFDYLKSSGVVLSGYDLTFSDPVFHSRFDVGNETISVDDVIM
jgi:hypothetical protein